MKYDNDEVFERVKDIIHEQIGVDKNIITLDASFIDKLGADSLDIVEMIMAFEEEFGTEIPDDEAEQLSTVSDAVNYIVNHIE